MGGAGFGVCEIGAIAGILIEGELGEIGEIGVGGLEGGGGGELLELWLWL